MKTHCCSSFICMVLLSTGFLHSQTRSYYGAHITAAEPWINRIDVYNNGTGAVTFNLNLRRLDGQTAHDEEYTVPPNSCITLVMPNDAAYAPAPGEIMLSPVEGTAILSTVSEKVRPKLSYQFGSMPSVSEFFLQDTRALEYVIPNPSFNHFSWLGLAVMNPHYDPITVTFAAYKDGVLAGSHSETISPQSKYVRLSHQIWQDLDYSDFDQVKIYSAERPFPAPISITGNETQDRHLFFNGESTGGATAAPAGKLYAVDSIVGTLRYAPAGTFIQGSASTEPCWAEDEAPFAHTLTRSLAVMSTEVTRAMWGKLSFLRSTLPPDPTDLIFGSGDDNPVQSVTWFEAVLFANLLSQAQGLTPCYYLDAAFTVPLSVVNYINNNIYCDFDADGYRLPTEGEWEYFARAGTGTPFWMDEANYSAGNCSGGVSCTAGTLPHLEAVAWFCANRSDGAGYNTTKPVGLKAPSPWGLFDVYGNVYEWCWDWQASYRSGSVTDYTGPESGEGRMIRGASFGQQAGALRSANRRSVLPGQRNHTFGFRLVRTVP